MAEKKAHPKSRPPLPPGKPVTPHQSASTRNPVTPHLPPSSTDQKPVTPLSTSAEKPVTPHRSSSSGSYIVNTPRNQVHRVPQPKNVLRYHYVKISNPKSSSRRRYIFYSLLLFFLLLISSVVVFYLVFLPKCPIYSVKNVSIKSFNLTTVMSPSPSSSTPSPLPVSPEFDITFKVYNPSNRIGIYYEKGSFVQVFYSDVSLFEGVLPQFFQPSKNETVFKTVLEESSDMEMTRSVHDQLVKAKEAGKVPLKVNLRAPVKFKAGLFKTWTMNVKVQCRVAVDVLTSESWIVSKDCHYGVRLW